MNIFQPIINSFQNLKLGFKFVIILFVFLIGMSLIAFAFNSSLSTSQEAIDKTQELGEFTDFVDKVQIKVLEAQSFEKEFRLTNELSFLEKFEGSMASAHIFLSKLLPLLQTSADKKLLDTTKTTFNTFQDNFFIAVESLVEVGLDENSGLQGSLNTSSEELAENISKSRSIVMSNIFLTMRTIEKNFLKTGDVKNIQHMQVAYKRFILALKKSELNPTLRKKLSTSLEEYKKLFNETVNASQRMASQFNDLQNEADKVAPLMAQLIKIKDGYQLANNTHSKSTREQITRNFIIVIIAIPLIIGLFFFAVARGILTPIFKLRNTVEQVAAGELDARAEITSTDEIGTLAKAFDSLLNERVSTLAKSESEHKNLNHSIVRLLESVAKLSQKDLTIRVPVSEDMTGAVSDSLNLLTDEISEVLKGVNEISVNVNKTSKEMQSQSRTVMSYAETQGSEVDQTLVELKGVVTSMINIAKASQATDKVSKETMQATETALDTVNQSLNSINKIREIVRETEKRIKRLGDRSQEISGVVNIINEIAERTHVLSLNAGMQAASAGDAGRGFMVVANEVQRLAESSREATSEISTLVKNIQIDTTDTVNTMNDVIAEVVDGTKLAEQAGEQMKGAQKSTQTLADSVHKIAQHTLAQVKIGQTLMNRAEKIKESTVKTEEQLQSQNELSDTLVANAEDLVTSVHVFTLPE
ncbi:MAG: HAMP domain-containing protein [Methylococcales bacterium]|nr:HAMP domain-containing protein [Methylococcales bacterium]